NDRMKDNQSKTWKWVHLKDIAVKIPTTGKKIKQNDYLNSGDLPVVDQGEGLIGGFTDDLSKKIDSKPPFIIFGDHTKKVKFINFDFVPGADGLKVLKSSGNIESKLLKYFLQHITNVIPNKGYARHFQYVEKEKFPLPPIDIQHRIVEKIEALFSELDNGIEKLKKAKQQLETYKQSVLKAAFEGKLTKEWRERQDDLPTPEELRQQIEEERKKYREQQLKEWEQEVEEWKANGEEGKKPRKPRKARKIEKLTDEEINELHELPKSWIWIKLGRTIQVSSGKNLTKSEMDDGNYPVYGGNGISGYHSEHLYENKKLIIGRVGAKCGVMHFTKPKSWVTDNALVVRFLTWSIDENYLKYRLEHE